MEKCAVFVRQYNSSQCLDYAAIQEASGYLCLMTGRIKQAEQYFNVVRTIYRKFYVQEPEQLAAKEAEIYNAFIQAGINIISQTNRDREMN